ncbi:MAG: hypothetical protein RR444_00995 [Oscillospiraceae bacterium]
MLGKLLRYEFKSTARLFLPFYGAIILLSLLNRVLFVVLNSTDFLNIPRVITMATYVFIIIATFIMTYVVMIQRFYKSLLSEEGYLSMTLPVKTSSHLLSKGIVAFVWILSTLAITLLSIFLILPDYNFLSQIPAVWQEATQIFQSELGISLNLFIVIMIGIALVSIISSILMIYTAIAFGQLSNKHKVLTSFGAYVAIYAIIQAINIVLIASVASVTPFTEELPVTMLPSVLLGVLSIQLIYGVAYFFITRYLLDKKLNLE